MYRTVKSKKSKGIDSSFVCIVYISWLDEEKSDRRQQQQQDQSVDADLPDEIKYKGFFL